MNSSVVPSLKVIKFLPFRVAFSPLIPFNSAWTVDDPNILNFESGPNTKKLEEKGATCSE